MHPSEFVVFRKRRLRANGHGLTAEVFVEESSEFAEGFFGFKSLIVELVLSVRFTYEDLQGAKLAVHANDVALPYVDLSVVS